MINEKKYPVFNLRWLGIAYCFFVAFHLLPTYVAGVVLWATKGGSGYSSLISAWILLGLAAVGFFIGHRSREFTALESGLAAILYILTLAFSLPWWLPLPAKSVSKIDVYTASLFITATLSVWLGELVRLWELQRRPAGSAGVARND
jgi:hypothetical protein